MRLGITGGTGLVGRFLVAEALAAGDAVTLFTRSPLPPDLAGRVAARPFDLAGPPPDLSGLDALVHAALVHVPGRYRGGEGDDPAAFRAANETGTARLFEAAAGLDRVVFLSSRAVYGPQPPGTVLAEHRRCAPDTLYGQVKLAGERALARHPGGVCLRATGVYGPPAPGQRHKWADLFAEAEAGRPVAPRAGTEVHGADLAAAMRLALTRDTPKVLNVSDILLDRRDLLALWAEVAGRALALPERADPAAVNVMDTARLRALGWAPRGLPGLRDALAQMAG